MIVEHSIVTTAEEGEARGAAASLLRSMGFSVDVREDTWLLGGRPGAKIPQSANEMGLTVRGAFDRQRVSFALTAAGEIKRNFALSNSKPPPSVAELLTVILMSFERRLADGMSEADAVADWRAMEERLTLEARARRRKQLWVACGVVAGFVLLLVVVIALVNANA